MNDDQFAVFMGLVAIVGIGLLLMGWVCQRAYLRSVDKYNAASAALSAATQSLNVIALGIFQDDEQGERDEH